MLCGNKIINDIFIPGILDDPKFIPGVDYKFINLEKTMVQVPKPLGSNFFKYKLVQVSDKHPFIGRYYVKETKTITDVVFSLPEKYAEFRSDNPAFTLGWDYCLEYTSTATVTMGIVNKIVDTNKRKNPLYVATFIAANLDSNNSKFGIIEGNWDIKDYKPDQCPSYWKDSGMIFRKYLSQVKKPVKYAQCWIFGELLTGMLRFLGIRARTTKIHNCHIDLHNLGGVDLFDPAIKTKASDHIIGSHIADVPNTSIDYLIASGPELKDINISKYIRSTEELFFKTPEFEHNILEGDIVKTKGYLYNDSRYITPPCSEEDLLCLNYLTKAGKSWNFHVWTEVYANKKWWVLDPSPLNDYIFYDNDCTALNNMCEYDLCNSNDFGKTKDFHIGVFAGASGAERRQSKPCQYPELKGKKFFGPVSIESIKNNVGIGNSFKYLQAAVNGPVRYWGVIFPDVKDSQTPDVKDIHTPDVKDSQIPPNPIFYLKHVVYNLSKVVRKNTIGHIIDVTSEYRRSEKEIPDDYYCLHRYNPIYLYMDTPIKSFKDLKIKYRHFVTEWPSIERRQVKPSKAAERRLGVKRTGFIVQTCTFHNDVLLTVHRYFTPVLEGIVKQNLSIGDDPRANKLTIVIYCLSTERWWSQMIRL